MNHAITVRRVLSLAHLRLRLLARRPVARQLRARRDCQRGHGERVGGRCQLQQGKDQQRGRLVQNDRPNDRTPASPRTGCTPRSRQCRSARRQRPVSRYRGGRVSPARCPWRRRRGRHYTQLTSTWRRRWAAGAGRTSLARRSGRRSSRRPTSRIRSSPRR